MRLACEEKDNAKRTGADAAKRHAGDGQPDRIRRLTVRRAAPHGGFSL